MVNESGDLFFHTAIEFFDSSDNFFLTCPWSTKIDTEVGLEIIEKRPLERVVLSN